MNASYEAIGACEVDPTARICSGALVGKRYRPLVGVAVEIAKGVTRIRESAYVGHYTIVGAGSDIGAGAVLDDFSVVECDVTIGKNTLLIYRAHVCNDAVIGHTCVIGGLVAERVIVGDRCRIFGEIVHSQHDPSIPWDSPESEEGSATIEDDVFVGFRALVIGKVNIGKSAYVCAGAIVTRDLPAGLIACRTNTFLHPSEWKGKLRVKP